MSKLTTNFKTLEKTPEELKEMWANFKPNTEEISVQYKQGDQLICSVIHLKDSIKDALSFWTPDRLASAEILEVTGAPSEPKTPAADLLENTIDV